MSALDALQVNVSVYSRIKNALDLSTTLDTIQRNLGFTFTDGAAANQADIHWSDERTLAANASEDLDLNGGLTDAFGAAIAAARVKILLIESDAANTNDVLVQSAPSNAFTALGGGDTGVYAAVKPGGLVLFIAPNAEGYVVTAGTGDLLRIANPTGGTSVKYRITLVASLS